MAGGWTRDGNVSEQIEASLQDEMSRLRARPRPVGASFSHCAECEEEIPRARRDALPGVKLCLDCQQERDSGPRAAAAVNRRGSKGTQMR